MSAPYTFRTEPHLVEKVWGGRGLESWGKQLPGTGPFGESWEVADLPEGQSRAATGPEAGSTLRELVQAWGSDLTGAHGDRQFPLLVKILDANADLSVQVHPGEDDLHRFPDARSKDEAWLILESDSGSILHGFDEGIDEAEFRSAIDAGRAEQALRRVDVAPGELYRVSPGTVHAICSGVQLLEVQQPSDTTFRVWDYERPGLDGNPRPLHLEQALAVMKWDAAPVPTAVLGEQECAPLIATDHYSIASWRVDGSTTQWHFDPSSPTVVFVLEGALVVDGCRLERGQTAIVPACRDVIEVSGDAKVVVARA